MQPVLLGMGVMSHPGDQPWGLTVVIPAQADTQGRCQFNQVLAGPLSTYARIRSSSEQEMYAAGTAAQQSSAAK